MLMLCLTTVPMLSPVIATNGGDATGDFEVMALPEIISAPTAFSFSTLINVNPDNETLEIWNNGTGWLNWTLGFDYPPNATAWLNATPMNGTSYGDLNITANRTSVNVSVNVTGLGIGDYNATINITAPDAININGSLLVPVTLSINQPGNGNGGGGGGGGGGAKPVELLSLCSIDGLCCLLVDEGTVGFTADGDPLEAVTMNEMSTPPPQIPGCLFFTKVYDAGPHNATFEPQITIMFYYNESEMPLGMTEEELIITTWNETAYEWVVLESSVNAANNTVAVEVSHFTPFTVLACAPSLPNFIASELIISPPEVYIGGEVTIGITIINTGELTGRHAVVLNVNSAAVETKEVTLAGGVSQEVIFIVTEDAIGTYYVAVDGRTGKFDVIPLPPSWIGRNWWIIWLTVIAAGASIYFLIKAKRRQAQSSWGRGVR
jgi:hypothetical protein